MAYLLLTNCYSRRRRSCKKFYSGLPAKCLGPSLALEVAPVCANMLASCTFCKFLTCTRPLMLFFKRFAATLLNKCTFQWQQSFPLHTPKLTFVFIDLDTQRAPRLKTLLHLRQPYLHIAMNNHADCVGTLQTSQYNAPQSFASAALLNTQKRANLTVLHLTFCTKQSMAPWLTNSVRPIKAPSSRQLACPPTRLSKRRSSMARFINRQHLQAAISKKVFIAKNPTKPIQYHTFPFNTLKLKSLCRHALCKM